MRSLEHGSREEGWKELAIKVGKGLAMIAFAIIGGGWLFRELKEHLV